jgi:hypothetical protein
MRGNLLSRLFVDILRLYTILSPRSLKKTPQYTKIKNGALQGSACVQTEPSAGKVTPRLDVPRMAEAAGHALDLLNLAVEVVAHRMSHGRLRVGQNVVAMPPNGLRRLANRFQPTVCRPEILPFPELPV